MFPTRIFWRYKSVLAIKELAAKGRGVAQIFMGDLNAEPQEPAMRALLEPVVPSSSSSSSSPSSSSAFKGFSDAWLALHPEPEPGSTDKAVRFNALTFPSVSQVLTTKCLPASALP